LGNLLFASEVEYHLHFRQVVHDATQNINEVNPSRLNDSWVSAAEDLRGTGAPQDLVSCWQKRDQ
jgi:hypothetical protein